MQAHFTSRHVAIAAAGGVLAVLSFSGVAQAITDTVFKYTSPRTSYYSIGHLALNPLGSAFATGYVRDYSGGLQTNPTACFGVGVNLPQGATVTEVRVWYKGSTGGNPSFVFLVQRMSSANSTLFLAAGKDNTGTSQFVDVPVGSITINNIQNAYEFATCLNPNDTFHAARITYTAGNAGD